MGSVGILVGVAVAVAVMVYGTIVISSAIIAVAFVSAVMIFVFFMVLVANMIVAIGVTVVSGVGYSIHSRHFNRYITTICVYVNNHLAFFVTNCTQATLNVHIHSQKANNSFARFWR